MQNDGNLVIYNKAVARNDYAGGSVVWAANVNRVGGLSGGVAVSTRWRSCLFSQIM